MNKLIELLPETMTRVTAQLTEDEKRWGDTWRQRDIGGQEVRIYDRLDAYFVDWEINGTPIPWEKIIGLAHIAMVRTHHPELLIAEEE